MPPLRILAALLRRSTYYQSDAALGAAVNSVGASASYQLPTEAQISSNNAALGQSSMYVITLAERN